MLYPIPLHLNLNCIIKHPIFSPLVSPKDKGHRDTPKSTLPTLILFENAY